MSTLKALLAQQTAGAAVIEANLEVVRRTMAEADLPEECISHVCGRMRQAMDEAVLGCIVPVPERIADLAQPFMAQVAANRNAVINSLLSSLQMAYAREWRLLQASGADQA